MKKEYLEADVECVESDTLSDVVCMCVCARAYVEWRLFFLTSVR